MTCFIRACSHNIFCCTGTAGEIALASHFLPDCWHLGYWTCIFLNIKLKRKHLLSGTCSGKQTQDYSAWIYTKATQRMVPNYSHTWGYLGIFIPALGGEGGHLGAWWSLHLKSSLQNHPYHLPPLMQDVRNTAEHYRCRHGKDFLPHLEFGE